MSCQNVFCRQHLGVYAELMFSRKMKKTRGWCCLILHKATPPLGNDDGSPVAPKDGGKPIGSRGQTE